VCSEISPMRVVIKIIKASPPSLQARAKWSPAMHALVGRCLTKLPSARPTCAALLDDEFVVKSADPRPLMQLLVEAYQSSVINEEIEEIDVRFIYDLQNCPSLQDDGKSGVSSGDSATTATSSGVPQGRPDVCVDSSPADHSVRCPVGRRRRQAESAVTTISVDTLACSKPCAPSPPASDDVSTASVRLDEEAIGVLDELYDQLVRLPVCCTLTTAIM